MFTPTKKQLEEYEYFPREFDESKLQYTEDVFSYQIPNSDYQICFYPDWKKICEYGDIRFTVFDGYDDVMTVFPESLEDIKTLIRLLTPHDNN